MRIDEKTLRALGLCSKAGKLICGTPLVCEAMKNDRSRPSLVLTASDNSENTAKRLQDRCRFYGVRQIVLDCDGNALSDAIGKSGRVAAVAITDENLCRLVLSTLE